MRRALVAGSGLVLLSVALTACSGGDKVAKPAAALPTAASLSPMVPTLTGTQLKALLVTDVPGGYTEDPNTTQDTGTDERSASLGPAPTTADCGQLDTNAFVDASGLAGMSFAQRGYTAKTGSIYETIDVYRDSIAETVMARMATLFAECKTYTVTGQGVSATEHMVTKSLPDLGPGALEGVSTSPTYDGGTTVVVARSGNAIVSILDSSPGADKGAGAVTMAATILTKLKAAQHY